MEMMGNHSDLSGNEGRASSRRSSSGDGTPFFHVPGGRELSLERVRVETLPHAVNLWFRPVPARP
jgi:hypothetical protein